MADEKRNQNAGTEQNANEPAGLGEHAHGHAAEIAHEQGWGTNEDERKKQPEGRPEHYGGKGYDYGAQDFGDAPAKRDNAQGTDDEKVRSPERKASWNNFVADKHGRMQKQIAADRADERWPSKKISEIKRNQRRVFLWSGISDTGAKA